MGDNYGAKTIAQKRFRDDCLIETYTRPGSDYVTVVVRSKRFRWSDRSMVRIIESKRTMAAKINNAKANLLLRYQSDCLSEDVYRQQFKNDKPDRSFEITYDASTW